MELLSIGGTFNGQVTVCRGMLNIPKSLRFYYATIAYHVGLNALLVAARNYNERLRKKDIILGRSLSPDNSLLVAHRWATSGKSVGPPEVSTGGPPSFCPLGQRWPTSGNMLVEIL